MAKSKAGRTCVDRQLVWSPKSHKYVTRCASFANVGDYNFGLDSLGDDVILEFEGEGLGKMDLIEGLGLNVETLKNAVRTGGVAAGGAWISAKLTNMLIGRFPQISGKGIPEIVNLLFGIITGSLVSKYYKPELGANMMVGPATISAISLLNIGGEMMNLSQPSAIPTAGYGPFLGGGQDALGLMTARSTNFVPVSEPPTKSFVSAGAGQSSIV